MTRGFEIIQRLFVGGVQVSPARGIEVALHDGATSVGTITWRHGPESVTRLAQLRAWLTHGTAVTYVRRGSEVALIDEHHLLQRALAG